MSFPVQLFIWSPAAFQSPVNIFLRPYSTRPQVSPRLAPGVDQGGAVARGPEVSPLSQPPGRAHANIIGNIGTLPQSKNLNCRALIVMFETVKPGIFLCASNYSNRLGNLKKYFIFTRNKKRRINQLASF